MEPGTCEGLHILNYKKLTKLIELYNFVNFLFYKVSNRAISLTNAVFLHLTKRML